jgi:hypothetical protein
VKESNRAWLMLAVAVAVGIVSYKYFFQPFMREEPKVRDVINANSTWSVTMQEYMMSGPFAAETYRITNDNGKIAMFYAATNRAGTVTKEFNVPLIGPDGTFLFEELRADGIWELDDRPVRPHPADEYVIETEQTLGDEGGTYSFSFSDPHFWAMTNAKEFDLKPAPSGSSPGANTGTVGVAERLLHDDRYLKIVAAIKAFGPTTVREAEDKIRSELAETAKHPIAPR